MDNGQVIIPLDQYLLLTGKVAKLERKAESVDTSGVDVLAEMMEFLATDIRVGETPKEAADRYVKKSKLFKIDPVPGVQYHYTIVRKHKP